jgi:hypothetical protein
MRLRWALLMAGTAGAIAVVGGPGPTGATPSARSSTPSHAEAKLCRPGEVSALVRRFAAAFNRGDRGRLRTVFADEPEFRWYSTDAPGKRLNAAAADRSTLGAYLARRHARGEQLALQRVQVNGNTRGPGFAPYGNFEFTLTRSARDLPATQYLGKGAVYCHAHRADTIFVWSMGRDAELSPP